MKESKFLVYSYNDSLRCLSIYSIILFHAHPHNPLPPWSSEIFFYIFQQPSGIFFHLLYQSFGIFFYIDVASSVQTLCCIFNSFIFQNSNKKGNYAKLFFWRGEFWPNAWFHKKDSCKLFMKTSQSYYRYEGTFKKLISIYLSLSLSLSLSLVWVVYIFENTCI